MGAAVARLSIEDWIGAFRQVLEDRADPDKAGPMAAYMRNQFPFFGIKTPDRKAAFRELCDLHGLPPLDLVPELFQALFQEEEREFQYLVNDIGRRLSRKLPLSILPVLEELIGINSWWDTVDFLAPKLAGHLLLRHPRHLPSVARKWIASDNIWYQRSAILLQLDYKEATREELLFECLQRRADSEAFFVQKASGWALRQYSRVKPEAVICFMDQHQLAPLTLREGRKWLDRNYLKN